MGGGATDNPESEAVPAEVREVPGHDPGSHEGFGPRVTEALWKKKPVVTSVSPYGSDAF